MHEFFMHRCLTLAEQGRGCVGINPLVGAVLVRDGVITAEGFHEGYGKAHAERHIFEKSAQKINSKDTLYVNLEPCCHTEKKTLPCAQMIIERGVKTVVYGMKDPNPAVSGKGIELLIKNSVQVIGPVIEQDCRRFNRGFVSLMTKNRPWITLKKAMTVDGKIRNIDGSPLKITSEEQDRWAHRMLRARHDAILVGVQTIIADDPLLTVRVPGLSIPQPYRIILDPTLRIPVSARVASDVNRDRTIIITGQASDTEARKKLTDAGVRVFSVPCEGGAFVWTDLWKVLTTPFGNFFGISSILVEGGQRTWEIFERAGMVDESVEVVGSKREEKEE